MPCPTTGLDPIYTEKLQVRVRKPATGGAVHLGSNWLLEVVRYALFKELYRNKPVGASSMSAERLKKIDGSQEEKCIQRRSGVQSSKATLKRNESGELRGP